jgi:hypothetical protein
MSFITSQSGQSVSDLCLMSYGTLDLLVKFCADNEVDDVNYVPPLPTLFTYDSTLVNDQLTNNYIYATATDPALLPTDYFYVSQGGNFYVNQFNSPYIPD